MDTFRVARRLASIDSSRKAADAAAAEQRTDVRHNRHRRRRPGCFSQMDRCATD